MSADEYKKKIVLIIIASTLFVLICGVCLFLLGCGNETNSDCEPVALDEVFSVHYQASDGGYIYGEAEQIVKYNQDASTVKAKPNEGYEFVKWSDGVKVAERQDSNVKADVSARAIFSKKKYSVTYTTDGNGVLQGVAEQEIEYGNSATIVTAKPNEGYEFVKWSDGVKVAERQDSNVKADVSARAIFSKKKYSVTYTTDGNGVLQGVAEQEIEYGNSATIVTAKPNEGYEFVKWSDGVKVAERQDSNIFTVLNVKAEFQKKVYEIKYIVGNNNEGGIIQGDVIQYVAHGESGSTVKAVPNEGYEFDFWYTSDDEQRLTAERTDSNITQNTKFAAFFRRKKVTVKYNTSEGGYIYYIKNNFTTIDYGGQSSVVRAEPNRNSDYVFLYWSDGLKTAERTEYNVKRDIVLTAYFGYSAEYRVNNGVGGKIVGETYQAVLPNADFISVEAVPDKGYVFGGWSDLQTESIRQDTNAERCIEHIAYFEPIIRTFNYDYGIASGIPMESTVTINRENIILDGYPTPEVSGYTFDGWYADSEYRLKVINGDGRYMLGYYGFSLDTDTLYARWKSVDVGGPVFKVLLLFVNEVEATLYPAKIGGEKEPRNVHHIMTTIDREFCAVSHSLVSKYLTEWLSDLTTVEVDAYYTTQNAGECIDYWPWKSDNYFLDASDLQEMSSLYMCYNSILSVFGVDNLDGYLANRSVAGTGSTKYADIYLENFYYASVINHRPLQNYLSIIKTDDACAEEFIDKFIHEFVHTCEQSYNEGTIMNFHRAFYSNYHHMNDLQAMRLYLLCEIEYNGEIGGLPKSFWTERAYKLLKLNVNQAASFARKN
ncbi:MAG: InlB B-repeat-containing protein [Clostridiales bacterium]|nr:InlB B-repeat-containing protein [Clostridiales bacterium]